MNDYIDNIMSRIMIAFNKNADQDKRHHIWNWCNDHSNKVEITKDNLENMSNNALVFGFFGLTCPPLHTNTIIAFAKAVGFMGIENPESAGKQLCKANLNILPNHELLQKIEENIGFKIYMPDFIGNGDLPIPEHGIITNRHCYYLWILKKIIELCPDRNTGIIEIGAGMGFLGYYLDKMGYKDYTTIDLARVNACQTYFLARNLPDREIILSGEKENPFDLQHKDSIKILHSSDFKNIEKNRFGIMINTDSLTEMIIEEANKYIQSDCAPLLLSINHEINEYRVIDLARPYWKLLYRYPFWLRDGYVEELYQLENH